MHAVLQAGDEVNAKYRVVRPLGSGGMGVVYEAVDRSLGRTVALKVLATAFHGEEIARQRLMREGRATARLRHPSIVQVYEVGSDAESDIDYVAMELLLGEDLHTRLKRSGILSVGDAIQLALQLVDALVAMHQAGVIHRDLKPKNLFLLAHEGGEVLLKVLDFGIARSAAEPDTLSRTGDALGSIQYMPPEQLNNIKSADERSDIYSATAVLFEVLVGHPPNAGETLREIVANMVRSKPRSIADLRPELPRALASIIDKGLRPNPEQRFPSAVDMREALRCVARETVTLGDAPTVLASQSLLERPTNRRWMAWAILTLATLGGVLWTISSTHLSNERDRPAVSSSTLHGPTTTHPPAPAIGRPPAEVPARELVALPASSGSSTVQDSPREKAQSPAPARRIRMHARPEKLSSDTLEVAPTPDAVRDVTSPAGSLSWSELVP